MPAAATEPGRSSSLRIAAVVLNYRTPSATASAVRSLQSSNWPALEVIIVENGSEDGSADSLRAALPGVTILESPANLGFAGGCNVGIRHALSRDFDAVLLVNSDATIEHDGIARLAAAIGQDPTVGIAGPVLLAGDDTSRIESMGLAFSPSTGRMVGRSAGRAIADVGPAGADRVDAVSGAVMLIKRTVFDKIGLLEEAFFYGFEDLDFCLRSRQAGFLTVVVGGAHAVHGGSLSVGSRSPRRLYFAARNHLLLVSRLPDRSLIQQATQVFSIFFLNLAHAVIRSGVPLLPAVRAILRGTVHHFQGRYGSDV